MDAFLSGIYSVITIAIMMLVGMFIEKRGWLKNDGEKILSKLVVNFGLPCTLFTSFLNNFSKEAFLNTGWPLVIPIIIILLLMGFSYILAKIIKVKKNRIVIFIMTISFANLVFIGLPVVVSLFGESAKPIAMINFFSQTILFWTLGIFIIRKFGTKEGEKISIFQSILKLFPPATVAFLLAIIFVFLEIKPPFYITKGIEYIGGIVTPLALIFSGAMVARQGISALKPDKDVMFVVMSRFIVAPLITFGIITLLKIPPANAKVILIQMSMPVMTQISIVAAMYGSDYKFAIKCFTISTVVLFAYIPIAMIIIDKLY